MGSEVFSLRRICQEHGLITLARRSAAAAAAPSMSSGRGIYDYPSRTLPFSCCYRPWPFPPPALLIHGPSAWRPPLQLLQTSIQIRSGNRYRAKARGITVSAA